MISINLTIFNKENLIEQILSSILENMSSVSKEIIFVFDGCTDRSEQIVRQRMERETIDRKYLYANNEFEVISNNKALKASTQPYCMIIQDDMLIQEKDFDWKLFSPFKFTDTFAVSARTAHNNIIRNGMIDHTDIAGKESNMGRGIYAVRDSCNRGPLLLRHDTLEDVGYLDEAFAPLNMDDHDLCMRVWKSHRQVSGSYMIDFRSDYEWGSSHTPHVQTIVHKSWLKNCEIIKQRHSDILNGEKHNEERECPLGIPL
jgi:glycosyltransferase involved in cell wall biosynthesis